MAPVGVFLLVCKSGSDRFVHLPLGLFCTMVAALESTSSAVSMMISTLLRGIGPGFGVGLGLGFAAPAPTRSAPHEFHTENAKKLTMNSRTTHT